MTRSVLLVAYHFPPLAGSSGIQRTLRFAQHLPAHGWRPLVLSAHPRMYERVADDLLAEVPRDLIVERAFGFDAARHLSLLGRYPGALAAPDRWMTWRWWAVGAGMRLIEKHKPEAIWSTYPIATAHEIGAALARRSGLPWIADFRDPMVQPDYPRDPRAYRRFVEIEKEIFGRAAAAVFTTRGSARVYRERFPGSRTRSEVIENGYDEESFAGLDTPEVRAPLVPGKTVLLHSGIVYPMERDPRAFFDALARLRQAQRIDPARLVVRLRAAVHETFLKNEIRARGLEDLVELAPPIPYRAALQEMARADALLVMQASDCNEQIPAKVYEYLRCGRPVLGLTDPIGDTADLLRRSGLNDIARIDDVDAIAAAVEAFLQSLAAGNATLPRPDAVRDASRGGRTRDLAALLAQIVR
jgi:glycosyltransferase involved in cell wall biosynthesis